MKTLYKIKGPNAGKSFELGKEIVSIGRAQDNDIPVEDKSVSRRHLKVYCRDNKYVILDLKSTNGTFINGKRVIPEREYEVGEGVPIMLGDICLTIGGTKERETQFHLDDNENTKSLSQTEVLNHHVTSSRNLELVCRVADVFTEALNINDILERILKHIFDFIEGIDRGAIILVDNDTGKISDVISESITESAPDSKRFSESIVHRVIDERNPVILTEPFQMAETDLSSDMEFMKNRSVMCVPLISRSKLRGVIYVDTLVSADGFGNEDLLLLTAVSGPAAIAIENAMFYAGSEKIIEERTKSLKDTERKLRENEARFKSIFENMSSGVVVFKLDENSNNFIIQDSNTANQRLERIKKADLLGQDAEKVLPWFKQTDLPEVFRRILRTHSPEHHSVAYYEKEKRVFWREYYIYRLPSGEIVSIFDDITQQKKAEEEQKELQKQLLVSQKMESIGAFAGGTAHNFRNILQAISGNIEYLEMVYGENKEVKDISKSIQLSVEKGVDLINNLLHFSKRGGEYRLATLDLTDLIENTNQIVDQVFDKNIRIHLELEQGLFVKGNKSFLSQVFMNLYTNARDAMPDGGYLEAIAKAVNGKAVVTVRDTGYGMDKKTQERIFDPFFTLKEVGKGTGLGLSTTHGIIAQHGGTINVFSEPGVGTTFKIELPLAEDKISLEHKAIGAVQEGIGQRVLIVDDEPPALDALTHLTKSLGYQPLSYDNPGEALKEYHELSPDIVLMDRNMPEIDGITCIRKIMEDDPDAKIIIISGYEAFGPDGIDQDIKGKIKGYLTKPCGREELGRVLSQALQQ